MISKIDRIVVSSEKRRRQILARHSHCEWFDFSIFHSNRVREIVVYSSRSFRRFVSMLIATYFESLSLYILSFASAFSSLSFLFLEESHNRCWSSSRKTCRSQNQRFRQVHLFENQINSKIRLDRRSRCVRSTQRRCLSNLIDDEIYLSNYEIRWISYRTIVLIDWDEQILWNWYTIVW